MAGKCHWLAGSGRRGKHNTQNPGRAITKATEYAASYYLGGLLGDALGGAEAGQGAAAATDAAESGGSLALNAAGNGVQAYAPQLLQTAGNLAGGGAQMTAEQLAKQALAESADKGLLGAGAKQSAAQAAKVVTEPQQGLLSSIKALPGRAQDAFMQGAYRSLVPGAGSQQADMLAQQTGDFGSYGLAKTMEAANSAQGLSSAQQLATKGLANYLGANGSSKVGDMALKMGGQNLMQQPQQQQPMQSRPAPQGQQEPLPQIYGVGKESPNALGTSNMSEAQKKYLRSLGYNV
jgi:hypothetical protein